MAHDLSRFKAAQAHSYATALQEIKSGHKDSHWMWYIFPQLASLGHTSTAHFYGISGIDEAKEYLKDELLSARLLEISDALLHIDETDALQVFGYPDNLKLRSSMTLFAIAGGGNERFATFQQVLDKFFGGEKDTLTINLLQGGIQCE